jgi:hypothetical protein
VDTDKAHRAAMVNGIQVNMNGGYERGSSSLHRQVGSSGHGHETGVHTARQGVFGSTCPSPI